MQQVVSSQRLAVVLDVFPTMMHSLEYICVRNFVPCKPNSLQLQLHRVVLWKMHCCAHTHCKLHCILLNKLMLITSPAQTGNKSTQD
jgi:hypothetical protein